MKLDVRALALAVGFLWSGCILCVGTSNVVWPGYGEAFLNGVSSIYPGFEVTGSYGDAVVGAAYGLLDGSLAGMIIAWLYNRLQRQPTAARPPV